MSHPVLSWTSGGHETASSQRTGRRVPGAIGDDRGDDPLPDTIDRALRPHALRPAYDGPLLADVF